MRTSPPARERHSVVGRLVVIGAGPTGLGAALACIEHGHPDVVVFEAEDGPGGLAGSVIDDEGFTWDLGGHVQFSHYERYDRLLDRALGDAWLHHTRTAAIRVLGHDVPYPFQHHLEALPPRERQWAAETLAAATGRPVDDSFAAWMDATFGEGICALFLRPYNRKVWQHPLEDMSAAWLGERVARPRAEDDAPRSDWGPNATFRYPVRGGTGAIWKGVARLLPDTIVRTGCRVVGIDPEGRRITLADGEVVPYDTLLGTMPLDALVACLPDSSPAVKAAAARLVANTVELVGVGVGLPADEAMRRRTWMYFPEADSPYYRVTVLSNYAASNAPDAASYSLLTESAHPRTERVDRDALVEATCGALERDGLLPRGAPIRSLWHRTLAHGYPVPTRGRDDALATLHAALAPFGIHTRGRFGGWKYEVSNQDHSLMQGMEFVEHWLHGVPEMTYHSPADANRTYHRG